MKIANFHIRFMMVILFITCVGHCLIWAESAIESDQLYDLYYEVSSFEVDLITNVKINHVESFFGIDFLVISSSGFKGKKGIILLSTVKAILPNGAFNPIRIFDEN